MTSQFFDKMVQVVENSVRSHDAHTMVEQQCRLMNIEADKLCPEDGGLFVMGLMSNLSDLLPPREWDILDKRFKKFLSEAVETRSKVKGIILMGTQDYVSLKRGVIALKQIRRGFKLPPRLRKDSWYPISILEELLIRADEAMLQEKGTRSRAIGRYVMSPDVIPRGQYWFGQGQPTPFEAFRNICEVLALDNFSLRKEDDRLIMSFKWTGSKHFQEFIMGICEGIFDTRNTLPGNIELTEKQNGSNTVFLRFRLEKRRGGS